MNSSETTYSENGRVPKFNEYRSQVMIGDLPSDFLRIEFLESQTQESIDSSFSHDDNPDFLGYLTLTISEAKLIKNSGPLGLLRMDPYVRFHIGHIFQQTPIAASGGKNPQWNVSYRINVYKGMDTIHIEIFDQRSFTDDNFIGQSNIEIPSEVFQGQTHQHWYPLMGREENFNENQGDILIIMSLIPISLTDSVPIESAIFPNSTTIPSSASSSSCESVTIPMYSSDDIQTIGEMFPTVDRQVIVDLLERYDGNKDLVVNHILPNNT